MHDCVGAQYPMISMTDALGRLINIRQQDNEPLLDHVRCFKELRDVVKSHLGSKLLDTFVEHQALYKPADPDVQETMKTSAYSEWMAFLLLRRSDPNKYGSLNQGLASNTVLSRTKPVS
jgi:hypothetical protein